jgi:transposase
MLCYTQGMYPHCCPNIVVLRLMKTGAAPAQTLVVLEATGIYWLSFATYFSRHGYAVSVVNPAQAHHFAKALLKRAKTDAIDAQTLTELAALLQPERWTPPPAIYEELEQRLTQRDDLLLMRGQLRNQLHALGHMPVVVAQVRQRMEALDQVLTAQLAALESELGALLPTEKQETCEEGEPSLDRAWAISVAKLQSIPGIGSLTALWIVVTTMNFTLCSSAEQAAAYAGLAPMPRQSAKVARCAAARKLLHLAFAVATNQ